MNKKVILAISIALVLVAVAVAVICLGTAPGRGNETTPQNTADTADTSTEPQGAGVGVRPERPEDPTRTTESEPVDPTENITVTIGVGKRPENPDTQTPDNTEPGEEDVTTDTKPDNAPNTGEMTWEEYLKLSPAERKAYYEQFESDEAFVLWFNAAKDAYENGNMLEAGKDPIDLSTIPTPEG